MLLVEDIKELEQRMDNKYVYIKEQTTLTHWWLKGVALLSILAVMIHMVNRLILTKY